MENQRQVKIAFRVLKVVLFSFFLTNSISILANKASWSTIEGNFKKAGGDLKALSHVKCFLSQYGSDSFSIKRPAYSGMDRRCYNKKSVEYKDPRYFTVIDYIKSGTKKRLFLVDTETGSVRPMGVAHGRYNTGYLNFWLRSKKNSLRWARHFSNTPGSKAPSSGFYMAGQEYQGKFGRSLILHGLEAGVNDNACERAIVIHKHRMVSNRRAYVMSSGCPMVSHGNINRVIDALKGKQSGIALEEAGGLVFIYSPRERAWGYGQCPVSK